MSIKDQTTLLSEGEQRRNKNLKPFSKGDPRINRAGRPRGCVDKTKLLIKHGFDGLLEDALANLTMSIKAGDPKMTQWFLELYGPAKLMQLITLDIPTIKTVNDLLEANQVVNEAMFNGEIAPVDANEVGKRLEDSRKLFETVELTGKMEKIEEMLSNKQGGNNV